MPPEALLLRGGVSPPLAGCVPSREQLGLSAPKAKPLRYFQHDVRKVVELSLAG